MEIGTKLDIADRLEVIGKIDCDLTLKDHKDSFYREQQARLLNPSKNPIGKISKSIHDDILGECRQSLNVNQLRSTQDAIRCFNKIENKPYKTFQKADIANY